MEKNMTEREYKNGNSIAVTYIMQLLTATLALTAVYLLWRSLTEDNHNSITLQVILLAVNVVLFLFEFRIRKRLRARL